MTDHFTTAKSDSQQPHHRILVVDDDSIICEIAESILADAGWVVERANTPSAALQKMASGYFPVVLCDVHFPGDNGELLASLRTNYPQTQVVMITGDPTIESIRKAMNAGAYDYLLKPVRREELLRVTSMAFDKFELLLQRNKLESENERYRTQLELLLSQKTDQLRDSELRYRLLFDHAVDAILLVNPTDGTIIEMNGAASKLIGMRSFDIHGTKIQDYVGDQLSHFLTSQGDDYRIWRVSELVIRNRDSLERVTNATINRIKLEDETVFQIVARDASEHSVLSQRASMMETELISEQRLANIGLLATGVAHNINTPLMGIYGLAQVIKMKHPNIEDIDGVIAQVERINGIIRNLMWKSRQEQEIAKQDIDLNVLLQEELRFLESDMEFKHNVEKQFAFAKDLPPIWGRYSDFSQSLMNIIRNALDSMHNTEMKQLSVVTSCVADDIAIVIQDNGSGIPMELIPQVFEPFFTTKPAVGKGLDEEPTGTGLGLSTVKKLLTPYGCRFDIQSEPGKGTTFTLFVPVLQNQFVETELQEMQS